jgi:hypothetical protein
MVNPSSSLQIIKAIRDCLNDAKAFEKSNKKIFIEACKEVEAAEGRKGGAIKDVHLELARKFEKLAKSAFLQASKSIEDAEARLEAAMQQYEIIDVGSDEDDEAVEDGDKKPAAIPVAQSKRAPAANVQEAAASTGTGSNKRAAASSSQSETQSKRQTVQSISERMMNQSHHTTNNEQAKNNTEVQKIRRLKPRLVGRLGSRP